MPPLDYYCYYLCFPFDVKMFGIANYIQVNILKRVLEEVEKVMQEFKAMLYKSMEDPHIELTSVS